MMTTMETHIMVENGISYVLGGGLYYLDLYLPEEAEYLIEKYGMLRKHICKSIGRDYICNWYLQES